MRAVLALSLLASISVLMSGCGITGCGSDEPVTIEVTAQDNLNTYDGAPHALDVYIVKVMEPAAFESADIGKLMVENAAVRGGESLNRQNVEPGETMQLPIGAMKHDMYTHVGVVAAYREAQGEQRMVAEIPSGCRLKLILGANGIISFTEAD